MGKQVTLPYDVFISGLGDCRLRLRKGMRGWKVYLNTRRGEWINIGLVYSPCDLGFIKEMLKEFAGNRPYEMNELPGRSVGLGFLVEAHKKNSFICVVGEPWLIKRRKGGWFLGIVRNWKVFWISYLRKRQVIDLYHEYKRGFMNVETLIPYARGWELMNPVSSTSVRESEGIGQEIENAAEDGTVWDKIVEYLEDGDYDLAKELAEEYGYDEEFKQLTGEKDSDEEDDREKWRW